MDATSKLLLIMLFGDFCSMAAVTTLAVVMFQMMKDLRVRIDTIDRRAKSPAPREMSPDARMPGIGVSDLPVGSGGWVDPGRVLSHEGTAHISRHRVVWSEPRGVDWHRIWATREGLVLDWSSRIPVAYVEFPPDREDYVALYNWGAVNVRSDP